MGRLVDDEDFGSNDFSEDIFGSDDSFGSNSFDEDDSFNSGTEDRGFGDEADTGEYNDIFSSDNANENSIKTGKKNSVILIAIGIVGVILVLIVAGAIIGKVNNKSKNEVTNENKITEANDNEEVENRGNAEEIIKDIEESNSEDNKVNYVEVNDEQKWMEVTDKENIEFKEEYTQLTFTITNIKHYARAVDKQNNLVVKTTLYGSLSGLSGVYTIDIPYYKGVKLSMGDNFSVDVKLGVYNNKVVVGDIKY